MFHKLDKTLVNKLFENQCVFIQVPSVNMHCELFPFLTLCFSASLSLGIPKAQWKNVLAEEQKKTRKREMQ